MSSFLATAFIYLRIGVIFFGGGYVLIPLLNHQMVEKYHILTLRQFLDGLALSQLTPGPLAMLATFTGFRAYGFAGAFVATICIFLPCTALMIFVGKYYQRLKKIEIIRNILNGILPAVVGMVAAAAFELGRSSLNNLFEIVVLLGGFLIFRFTKTNPMIVIIAAALIGFLR